VYLDCSSLQCSLVSSAKDAPVANNAEVLFRNPGPLTGGGLDEGGAITDRGVSCSREPLRTIPGEALEAEVDAATAVDGASSTCLAMWSGCSTSGVPHTMHLCSEARNCPSAFVSSVHCGVVSADGFEYTACTTSSTRKPSVFRLALSRPTHSADEADDRR
jgi:hypothetical protein